MATQYDTVATDETASLISSDKVEGTPVYNRQGEKLGSTHSLMIDKRSGKVAYAVMSFGGFLGIGATTLCPGMCLTTIHARAATSSISTGACSRGRRHTAPAKCRTGATRSGAGGSKITTASDGESSRPRRVR
jgi:PRC-barrel domain